MSKEFPPGAICYLEVPAPDVQKARNFYVRVFGWKIGAGLPGTDYLTFEDGSFGGGLNPDLQPSEHGVMLVLKVDDIPGVLQKITEAGGEVIKEKTEIGGGHGFYANFRDPNGNVLSIWARA